MFNTHFFAISPGADTGGVDRVDIHPPFFSKKKIRNVTLFEIENKERKKEKLALAHVWLLLRHVSSSAATFRAKVRKEAI